MEASKKRAVMKQACFYKECATPWEVQRHLDNTSNCYHIDHFQVVPTYDGKVHLFIVARPYIGALPQGARPIGKQMREVER